MTTRIRQQYRCIPDGIKLILVAYLIFYYFFLKSFWCQRIHGCKVEFIIKKRKKHFSCFELDDLVPSVKIKAQFSNLTYLTNNMDHHFMRRRKFDFGLHNLQEYNMLYCLFVTFCPVYSPSHNL